jgi:hypothetical protein
MDVSVIGPTILTSLKGTITLSVNELEPIKSLDNNATTLINDYNTLGGEIDTAIKFISTYTPTTFPEFVKGINTRIDGLNTRKINLMKPFVSKKEVSVKTIFSDTVDQIKNHIIFVTTFLGMMFGCIVATHWFRISDVNTDKNSFYFLFYAIFGALIFPIPVLYGVVNPPMWRAPLIPLFIKNETSPGWVNFPGISLFSYIPPTPNDLYVGKEVLRIMCIIVSGLIGVSMYLKITNKTNE